MNKIIYIIPSLLLAACSDDPSIAVDQPPPVTTVYAEKPCTDGGIAPLPTDAGPPVEVLDPCDGQYFRGMCDDRLLPTGWGFDKRCEDEGRVAYKSCADYNGPVPYRCPIRPTTREKCVEATGTFANQVILCCPEQ